jgi:hypothetical protein
LWANLHGAFVVGVGLLSIEVAAAVWRRDRSGAVRYLLVTAASVAGLLVNPWGVGVLGYAISLPTNRVVSKLITEWAPTSIHDLTGILVLGAVVVLVVALVRAPAPHRVPEQLLRMALLGGLAFWAVRGVAWFGLALPVALCALARPRPLRPVGEDRLVVASPLGKRALGDSRPQLTAAPEATADWLAANPQPGRMFNYQAWGSYLEFRLGPRVQVGFDSRIELPPADRWIRYLAVISGHWDAERQLDEWGVGHVVTSRRASPALVELLEASGRWRLVFSSGEALVYRRVAGG